MLLLVQSSSRERMRNGKVLVLQAALSKARSWKGSVGNGLLATINGKASLSALVRSLILPTPADCEKTKLHHNDSRSFYIQLKRDCRNSRY